LITSKEQEGPDTMRKTTFAIAGAALAATVGIAEAKPPKFKATCPTGIEVRVNNAGRVRINGAVAEVKEYNANAWDAKHGGVTISIGLDGGELSVMYTGKGGANGICQVSSDGSSASSGGAAGTPSKDEQACLQAVSQQTNNGDVVLLRTETSEANNAIIVGVGPKKAEWQCLVKNGTVAEVMSLTNEGAN
jgi:hypothetical protein